MKARFVCYLLYYAIQTYINCINAIKKTILSSKEQST